MIQVNDQTNTLSPEARVDLGAVATKHRVVANFVVASSKGALSQQMATCVTTPNTICIGVDAQHRFTATEFGYDTGIRKDDFTLVSRAGNADFHAGNWADGVKSIVARAEVMSVANTAKAPIIMQSPVVRHEAVYWPFVLGFGVLGAIVFGFIYAWRKARRNVDRTLANYQSETAEMASHNLEASEREDFDRRLRERSSKAQMAARAEQPWTPTEEEQLYGRVNRPPLVEDKHPTPVMTPDASLSKPSPRLAKRATGHRHPREQDRSTSMPSTSMAIGPTVIVTERSSGSDNMLAGMALGAALERSRHRTPTPIPERRRHRTPTPSPEPERSFLSSRMSTPEPESRSSFSSGGDSSDSSSSSSGGDSSSIDSSSSGGGSSDF